MYLYVVKNTHKIWYIYLILCNRLSFFSCNLSMISNLKGWLLCRLLDSWINLSSSNSLIYLSNSSLSSCPYLIVWLLWWHLDLLILFWHRLYQFPIIELGFQQNFYQVFLRFFHNLKWFDWFLYCNHHIGCFENIIFELFA